MNQGQTDYYYSQPLADLKSKKKKEEKTEGVCQLPTILLKSPTVNSRVGAVHTTLTHYHMHTRGETHTQLQCQLLGRTHVILSGLLLFTLPMHCPSPQPAQACSVKCMSVCVFCVCLANFNTITLDSMHACT